MDCKNVLCRTGDFSVKIAMNVLFLACAIFWLALFFCVSFYGLGFVAATAMLSLGISSEIIVHSIWWAILLLSVIFSIWAYIDGWDEKAINWIVGKLIRIIDKKLRR
ncbi:MAG: hypothetical protein PHT44_04175 [Candidatus Portnoybacteria bacterium]|nr:hypothetical protein [Candidatus Portnoybacteria bacterium]MDD4983181.1 hypothetical protein [Candidatus Portnoybacteria bacterium]